MMASCQRLFETSTALPGAFSLFRQQQRRRVADDVRERLPARRYARNMSATERELRVLLAMFATPSAPFFACLPTLSQRERAVDVALSARDMRGRAQRSPGASDA